MRYSTYFLGIGSNQGDRLMLLQQAVFAIDEKLGRVISVSSVYETPALGFEGAHFLNACLAVETTLSAEELLGHCLQLELQAGRDRSKTDGYSDRPLDIDLLCGPETLNTPTLSLPHPRMQQRRFVIEPLFQIAPQLVLLNEPISTYKLRLEKDHSQPIKRVKPGLFANRKALWQQSETVVLEGCIGVGKSTLCAAISARYELEARFEKFDENPYLERFYNDPKAYALPVELHFLLDRFDALKSSKQTRGVISDYHLSKSILFAENNLNATDFNLFSRYYSWGDRLLKAPGLYVLLENSLEVILSNIKKRGRTYEQNIDPAYLNAIIDRYRDFIAKQKRWNTLILDLSTFAPYDTEDFLDQVIDTLETRLLEITWKKQQGKKMQDKKGLTLF